jgi:hypothetical protein
LKNAIYDRAKYNAKAALEGRLAQGKIVTIEVEVSDNKSDNPWLKNFGCLKERLVLVETWFSLRLAAFRSAVRLASPSISFRWNSFVVPPSGGC